MAKFHHLSLEEKRLLVEAFFLLGFFRVVILCVKFKNIASRLGDSMKESLEVLNEAQLSEARKVGWAIERMSRHTPWESQCFVQALAAKKMLNSRKIASTLYFGLAKDQSGTLVAHAWLKSGGHNLTGGGGVDQFTVVSYFGG